MKLLIIFLRVTAFYIVLSTGDIAKTVFFAKYSIATNALGFINNNSLTYYLYTFNRTTTTTFTTTFTRSGEMLNQGPQVDRNVLGHADRLTKIVQGQLEDNRNTDVTIACSGGETVTAHSCILG